MCVGVFVWQHGSLLLFMCVHAHLLCVCMHVPVSMCMPTNMCIFIISVCLYMRLCSARVSVFRLHLLRCVSL